MWRVGVVDRSGAILGGDAAGTVGSVENAELNLIEIKIVALTYFSRLLTKIRLTRG
jgi:hypothetical protein